MGMSSTQARLLTLTSRQTDAQFKAQQITHQKLALTRESDELSQAYLKELDKTKVQSVLYSSQGGLAEFGLNQLNIQGGRSITGDYAPTEVDKTTEGPTFKIGDDEYRIVLTAAYGTGGTGFKFTSDQEVMEALNAGAIQLEKLTKGQELSDVDAYDNYSYVGGGDVINTPTPNSWLKKNDTTNYFFYDMNGRLYHAEYKSTSVGQETSLVEMEDKKYVAKAEAKYNADVRKVNDKDKKLDMQLKALETEQSALKTESETLKSLVKDNIEKTFNIFS